MTNMIKGKECSLEDTVSRFEQFFANLGILIEECSWLNPVPFAWSVHIKCKDFPLLFTNGKGSSKLAALASAYGEFIERFATQYFFADYYWNTPKSPCHDLKWMHHPEEKWVEVSDAFPHSILSRSLERFYVQDEEVSFSMLLDRNMGNKGVCCVPYTRERDGKEIFIPQNIIGNLYVSNGMSCGNSEEEAKVQALSEILERGIKNRIISEGITLPTIGHEFLKRFPQVIAGIEALEKDSFKVLVKDASLGGKYPVVNITLLNKEDAGVFCAFGAHPIFEVALERTLTELLQGRDLNQLSNFKIPSSDLEEVATAANLEEHFIDSAGVVSWKFLSTDFDYPFVPWGLDTEELGISEQWDFLKELVQKDQYEIYCSKCSYLGEEVHRVIVPGLSEIYPLDDLYQNNNNEVLPFYSLFFNIHNLEEDESYELLRLLDNMAFASPDSLADHLGILFPVNSFWQKITVGQFRSLLHIQLGQLEEALEELFIGNSDDLFWKGLQVFIELDEKVSDSVSDSLNTLFGEDSMSKIKVIVIEQNMSELAAFDFSLHHDLLTILKKGHK